jgi:DNA-binding MarR family transcriptional regulator
MTNETTDGAKNGKNAKAKRAAAAPPPLASLAEVRRHEPQALITFRVWALSQLLGRVVDAAVAGELGLTSRQWRVLVVLNRLGRAASGDVTRLSRLDHSQVSRASYELVERGLVSMQTDGGDRRRQMLEITPAGLEILRRGIVGSRARQRRLRARLDDEQYAALDRALTALTEEAQAMLDEARAGDAAQPGAPAAAAPKMRAPDRAASAPAARMPARRRSPARA